MKLRTAILLTALIFIHCSFLLPSPQGEVMLALFGAGLALLYWFTDRDNDRLIKALTRCSADVARNLRQQHEREREGSSTRAASGHPDIISPSPRLTASPSQSDAR